MKSKKGVSIRAFARNVGVTEGAIRKAIKSGRVVVFPDGSVNEPASLVTFKANTDPVRKRARTVSAPGAQGTQSKPAPIKTEQEAFDAVSLVKRVLSQEGAETPGLVDFSMARTAESILKSRERELKMAERRKELVPAAKVREHVSKAFIGYRQAMQRLTSRHAAAIAAQVGCDPGALDAALSKAIAAELDALSAPVLRI